MNEIPSESVEQLELAAIQARSRLSFDLDVDVCVIGGGLAGLATALECARLGASVAVLEGRQLGWDASGHQFGTVMPGFPLDLPDLIARVGSKRARELWNLSKQGADLVRANANPDLMPGLSISEGALEVSHVDAGDRLIRRLQLLSGEFDTEVEGWQVERVRAELRTNRYFHAIHYPRAFQIDGRKYLFGLASAARRAGVRIFEDTPVVSIDSSGIRKRIVTPSARLRAGHIVLAGNVHLGAAARRLSQTLLPVWRYAGITAPLDTPLEQVIGFKGSVIDTAGIDQFRVADGNRLMWASPETTWSMRPSLFAGAIQRRIRSIFPQLGRVEIAGMWSGTIGQTVHGMPQVGQLRKGVWVASGFGRQGLNTSAIAAQLIACAILWGDERWRAFAPFDLVWAGGRTGRAAGFAVSLWERGQAAVTGAFARNRERARAEDRRKEARLAEANRQAALRVPRQLAPSRPPVLEPRPAALVARAAPEEARAARAEARAAQEARAVQEDPRAAAEDVRA